MDAIAIADWLKNTVPGIVVLGAAGSFVAGGLIWLGRKLLIPICKTYFGRASKALFGFLIKPMAKDRVRLHFLTDSHKGNVYYSFQIIKFVLALFLASWCLVFFLYALYQPQENLLRQAVIAPLVIFFLSLGWAFRIFVGIMLPYYFDIDPIIKESIEDIEKNKKQPA